MIARVRAENLIGQPNGKRIANSMSQFSINPASIAQALKAPGAVTNRVPDNELNLDLKSAKVDFQALI